MSFFETFRAKTKRLFTISPARDEDTDLDLLAQIENLQNAARVREQEVERMGNCIQALERRQSDLVAENSDLEGECQGLVREKSALDRKYRETAGRLERAEAAGTKYRQIHEASSEWFANLRAQYDGLCAKNEEITRTNRNQEQEIKTLRDSNRKIRSKLETQVTQLNKLTGEIARNNQRVNTSAIRDDEYFAGEFAGLATDIRNWSFTHFFRSEAFVPGAVTGDFRDDIREIAGCADLIEIFKTRATSRQVIAGLLADRLRKELFDPLLLGLLSEEFTKFENMIEKTGTQKSQWLSQTIGLFIKSEQFEQILHENVHFLSQNLGEWLGGLAAQGSGDSKASKRNQKLSAIVMRAARLAIGVSQQPNWFLFSAATPGEQFNPYHMEDVGRESFLGEEDPKTCVDNCRVFLSIFPCVRRQEQVENGNTTSIVINKALVTVVVGDGHKAGENKGGDITNEEEEAKRGVECGEEFPGGHSEYEELGAEEEGDEFL